jgi:hypothetical protein
MSRFVTHKTFAGPTILFIDDYKYWLDNEPEIYKWMDETITGGKDQVIGMTVNFVADSELLAFCLRWA